MVRERVFILVIFFLALNQSCSPHGRKEGKGHIPPQQSDSQSPPQPPAEPAAKGIDRRKLPAASAQPYQLRNGQVRPLPVSAPGVFFGDAPSAGAMVVVGSGTGNHTGLRSWHLVDAASGKEQARFGSIWDGSRPAKVAIVAKRKGNDVQSLLRMDSGKILKPKPLLPSSKTVSKWRIVVDRVSPVVWLFVQDTTGQNYQGQWKDTKKPKVVVETFPIWPKMASGRFGIVVWTDEPNDECQRYLLAPNKKPMCRRDDYSATPLNRPWTAHSNATVRTKQM